MTLQIGLIGTDGIVVASDRLLAQWEGGSHSLTLTSKFLMTDTVVVCWSGDIVAQTAAQKIYQIDPSDEDVRAKLLRCADAAWRQFYGTSEISVFSEVPRKLIVAHLDELWEVDVLPTSLANVVNDSVVCGDAKNTARHFVNNYIRTYTTPINRSIKRLIFPASFAILAAHKENPKGVEGLEVVVIPKGEMAVRLSEQQEQELARRSHELSRVVERHFAEPFDYK